MNKLHPLKSRLQELSRRRWRLRAGAAAAGLLLAICWTLALPLAVKVTARPEVAVALIAKSASP